MSTSPERQLEMPPRTQWPDSAPTVHEKKSVSIVCGNSNIYWAFHDGEANQFTPTMFWRTPKLTDDELNLEPAELLSRHLPATAHDYIFGQGAPGTRENAKLAAEARNVPHINVYIVSSNDEQVARVNYAWKDIPSRVFLMHGQDFFSTEKGRYDTMGVDRLATLAGAGSLSGFPALVFDGGTALTYSAVDGNGNIMGGGITLGLGAKLRFLSDVTGALPHVNMTETAVCVARAENLGEPIGPFATDTKSAILASALGEIAYSGRTIIKHWLKEVGPAGGFKTTGLEGGEDTASGDGANANMEEMKTGGQKIVAGKATDSKNSKREILVTGGDADILFKLLQPDHSGVLQTEPESEVTAGYEIRKVRHMPHYGVQAVLEQKAKLRKREPEKLEWETALIGQRVAKRFDTPDVDGDKVYRGTVTLVKCGKDRANDLFKIVFDDDDTEDQDINDLFHSLTLYSEVGEKAASGGGREDKREASKSAADRVADERQKIEEENAKKRAEKEKAEREKAEKEKAEREKAEKERAEKAERARAEKAAATTNPRKRPAQSEETNPEKRAKRVVSPLKDPHSFKGTRIAKYFGTDRFFGTIVSFDTDVQDLDDEGCWHVVYEDDDEEDISEDELKKCLALYEKYKHEDEEAVGDASLGIDKYLSVDSGEEEESVASVPPASDEKEKDSLNDVEKRDSAAAKAVDVNFSSDSSD